jgi:putative flippase GtrA
MWGSTREMKRKGTKPTLKFGFDLPPAQGEYRKVMPFNRSWLAIAILVAMDVIFLWPAITTFNQAVREWGHYDSLFDLVAAAFLSAWLLGWVIAPIIMTGILVLLLFGREVIKASPGVVEIFFGIPLIGLTARYDVAKMRNLRFERPLKKSGTAWRGTHLLFDYGANTVAFGSSVDGDEKAEVREQLEVATGARIRRGEALAGEIENLWEPEKEVPPMLTPVVAGPANEAVKLTSASSLVLVAANLIPIAGSVFLDWRLADVMVLYWAESAIIGFFNVLKIAVVGRSMALLSGPFFVGHFGAFMAVHFLFLYHIFIQPQPTQVASSDELAVVANLFLVLWPALLALFISHAVSFLTNFIGRREYVNRTVNKQMSEPYGRIVFMHLVLIFGGGLTMILGGSTLVLLIVILLKIVFDVKAHLKQHAGI